MTRSEGLLRWRRIADGDLDREQYDPIDLHAWVREVAQRVIDADSVPDSVRPGTVLTAVCLSGKRDDSADLREHLALIDEFPWTEMPQRGQRMTLLIAAARASGLVEHDVSDPELRKRIERMLDRKP